MGKEDAPCDHKYDIVGGLCENNDKFAVDRMLPRIDIGDLLVIHDTGAHGHAMGYQYNGRLRSAEVLLQLVRDNGGFLPLNDDSAPEEVTRLTGTSKKVFKRSLGMLLKRGAVEAGEKGIKIRKHGED